MKQDKIKRIKRFKSTRQVIRKRFNRFKRNCAYFSQFDEPAYAVPKGKFRKWNMTCGCMTCRLGRKQRPIKGKNKSKWSVEKYE